MSIYNKVTNSVADAVSKIMNEKLHPNQQKLDVHEPEKDKLTAKDFEMLRKGKKAVKEESEQIQEYTSVGGKFVHRQKEVKDAEAGVTDWDKEEKMAKDADKPAAKKRAYGAHQNRRTNTKLYKEMIESLKTGGIKSLFKTIEEGKIELNEDNLDSIAKKHGMEFKKTTYGAGMKHPTHGEVSINRYGEWNHYPAGSKSSKAHGDSTGNFSSLDKHLSSLKEEASQEEFTKEMEDQKAKFDGKKKTADVAKPAVQAVQNEATHTEIQVIDMTDGSQKPVINIVDLEEKSLTEPEMKKKEEVVKSMKKGIAGFKERYGDRAKSVMYATATKIAKDKA
jgi:hypothetical protein